MRPRYCHENPYALMGEIRREWLRRGFALLLLVPPVRAEETSAAFSLLGVQAADAVMKDNGLD